MKILKLYLVVTLFFLISCQNQNNNTLDDHDHEAVNISYTTYDSNFEVFVEATPFIKGATSGILAHVTKLADFKPLEKGKVTASLITGSKGIRQTLETPTRKGIYLFQLQPEHTGKGKLVFDIQVEDSTHTLTIPNIEIYADEHDAIHEAEELTVTNPNAINFTKEQSWKVDFATGNPSVEPFGQVIKTTAHVQSASGDENILTAKTNGIVTFRKQNLTEGVEISSGKTLLSISGEAFADNNPQVRLNEAKNNFEKAEADYKRNSQLAKEKIVSEKALLNSKNEFENTTIIYDNLKKNFSKGRQNVVSRKTGFIKHIYVTNLQYVEAGDPLLSISQNKNLFLKADVQQKYISVLPFISTATIRTHQNNKVYTLEEINGEIVSFGKNVSDDNYMIPVTLKVENREGIVPGSFLEIFLKTKTNPKAITLTDSAILEEQGNYFVLVQLTPESFEKREIKIGDNDGIKTEILSGISATDRVVTRGAILVKLAAISNNLDPHAGHVH
jgi:cobalt-zinc-cadmium efflux system membrane fusion protein